ncbi:hypothetical protein [Stenotrophomonas maltophilia]|uniref:hypothetical protein n=1 Tax=Stenotrophomonas maltophilia TaxID=40324 RepID=UPI0039C13431
MAVQPRLRSVAARCGRLFLACGGLLALQAHAQQTYEAEEVAQSLLSTAMVHEEGLQLHRWLTGMQPDPPAGSESEIRMMTRALAMGTGLTDIWIDTLYGEDASTLPEREEVRKLVNEATSAGASRCIAHHLQHQPAGAPLSGYALERFKDAELPDYASVVDVQYRCISSYITAHKELVLATLGVLKEGRRPAPGALISSMRAGMQQDRRWPTAGGGELQLLSFWNGRAWSGDQGAVERSAQQMIGIGAPRPVDAATRSAMFTRFITQTAAQPAAPELASQIMLWIPPVLRGPLRGDVEAYVAAASPREMHCTPLQAQFIDEDSHLARVEVHCTVPFLDHVPVPVMGPSQDKALLEQHYRQVLTGLRHAIGDAPETTLTGFTTLRWDADTQGWMLPPGAHAALHSRGLLPTPVADAWGSPSSISRFLPAAVRVENIDPTLLDEESRQKIKDMRLQMAEALRNGLP